MNHEQYFILLWIYHKVCHNEWYKIAQKAYLHKQLHGKLQDLQDRGYLDQN
jgi:hypothetical protein